MNTRQHLIGFSIRLNVVIVIYTFNVKIEIIKEYILASINTASF